MTFDLEGVTFQGPPVDDLEVLVRLAPVHRALLEQVNGFVAYSGGLHVRGAVREPEWHSLRAAWKGREALSVLYPAVESMDVPFAQDAFGDQFLLREGMVYRLFGKTGDVENLDVSLDGFLEQACADPLGYLNLSPLEQFQAEGGRLLHEGVGSWREPTCDPCGGPGLLLGFVGAATTRGSGRTQD
jgi:hypothetical protein